MKYLLLLLSVSCISFLQATVIPIISMGQLQSILNTNSNVVIKFYADFCPPCKGFAPIYAQVSQETNYSSVVFVEVNTQQNRDIATRYGVQSIPNIVYVKDKTIIASQTGGKSATQFKNALKDYFSL